MNKSTVLIVEDDPIVASDIKYTVKDFGYDVCAVAASGEAAIAAADKHRPTVALMDITLEGAMTGIEAASEISKRYGTPVVYLTAHSDEATLQQAKLTLPYGYVLKPLNEIELKIALEMAIFISTHPRVTESQQAESHVNPPLDLLSSEQAELLAALRKIELFKHIPETNLRTFLAQSRLKAYKQFEMIYREGSEDQADGFIVLSGRVSMIKSSLSGRELTVQLLPPGDTFGLLSSLGPIANDLSARTQLASTILHVPKPVLLGLLAEVPSLYPELLNEASRRLNSMHSMARSLAHDKVDVRIAATLISLAERISGQDGDEMPEIPMTRQELADLTGTTVETAIRITKNLEKQEILDFPEQGVIRIYNMSKLYSVREDSES